MTQAIEKAKHTPELLDAAKAVVAQWDSPNWKLNQPTGELINDLRAAIAKAESHKDAMARISGEYDWLRGRTFHSLTPPVPSSPSMEAKMTDREVLIEQYAKPIYGKLAGVPDSVIREQFREFADHVVAALAAPVNPQAIAFQKRVAPWMEACFGPKISSDRIERNHRFLEEALELVQSTGYTASEAHQLVDYVYGTPVGETHQEIGGVMVTLAALCLAVGDDMHDAGETELARIWTKVEKIRAKQASKPKHSPLPEAPQPAPQADLVERLSLIERDHILDDNELRTIGEAIAALSAVPTQEPFAFCCTSFDIDACDCVNKNHGTARRG